MRSLPQGKERGIRTVKVASHMEVSTAMAAFAIERARPGRVVTRSPLPASDEFSLLAPLPGSALLEGRLR